jgi:crotonobetainyl-CoA hydratase
MSQPMVETRRHGRVLEIHLQRPKVNAISRAMSRAIAAAALELQGDPALSVGLITAPGERVFSAGWDFTEASALDLAPAAVPGDFREMHGPGGFAGVTQLWELTKPLIAAINGAAVGGGFEMALACDVIMMADHAYFELPEMQRGILPDAGGLQRLPRRLPYNVAMEMMLTGRRMDAHEAVRWGLAHRAVPAAELLPVSLAIAQRIAQGAPLALQALKEVLGATESLALPEAMRLDLLVRQDRLPAFQRMWKSEDAKEGPRAFLERRPPVWTGR